MVKKWMAITFALFVVTALLGWQLYNSVIQFNAKNDPSKIQPVKDVKQMIAQEQTITPPAVALKDYIPEEFAVIPENNVFSESRSSEEETTEEADQPEAPPLAQKPILVGINIFGSQKTALLIESGASSNDRAQGRAQIKRIGDVIQGHTIAEIAPDHIVLKSGSQKEIIPLHEGSKEAQRGKTPILSTRVVSFGGGAASGGSQVTVSSRSPSTPPTKVASIGAPSDQSASKPGVSETVSQQASSAMSGSSQPEQAGRNQQSPSGESSAPKTRVIRTPFGNIVRPVRE